MIACATYWQSYIWSFWLAGWLFWHLWPSTVVRHWPQIGAWLLTALYTLQTSSFCGQNQCGGERGGILLHNQYSITDTLK